MASEAAIQRACGAFCSGNSGRTPEAFAQAVRREDATAKHYIAVAEREMAGPEPTGEDQMRETLAHQIRGVAAGGTLRRDGSVSGGRA